MSFIPDSATLLQFTAAAIMLTVTPGPDMTLFLSRAISHGRLAGFACLMGASTGVLFHTLLAAVGLSALLAASPTAFTIVKFAGAGYLLFLGYQAIRHGSALNVNAEAGSKPLRLRRHYLTGIGINLMNPKIVLFFVSFLPLFVDANDPAAGGQMAFLGVFFLVIATPLTVPMIFAADWMADALKRNRKVARGMDYLFACVFGAFAAKIVADR